MTHALAYKCPYCHNVLQIEDDIVGEDMECPYCENPFKVDIPSATPADPSEVTEGTPIIERAAREEEVIESAHPAMFRKHPFWFLGEWALIVGGLALVVLANTGTEFIGYLPQLATGGAIAAVGGLMLLHWWLTVLFTNFSITNKRSILRRGIISRFTTEVQHDDIRNLQVDQNMFERLMGVGDIAISSSGQDDLEIDVDGLPRPNELADLIRNLQ